MFYGARAGALSRSEDVMGWRLRWRRVLTSVEASSGGLGGRFEGEDVRRTSKGRSEDVENPFIIIYLYIYIYIYVRTSARIRTHGAGAGRWHNLLPTSLSMGDYMFFART